MWLNAYEPLKVSYHPANFGGHSRCSGDIILVVEDQDFTCSLKSTTTIYHKQLLPENKGCCKANTINCLQSINCLNHSWDISLESQRWIKKHWQCENSQSFTLFSLILWDGVLQSTFFLSCNWHRLKKWALKERSCAISLRMIFGVDMINIIDFLFTLVFTLEKSSYFISRSIMWLQWQYF